MINTLKRDYLHIPLYAWLAGGAALALSVLYFLRRGGTSGTITGSSPVGGTSPPNYPQNVYASNMPGGYQFFGAVPGSGDPSPPPNPGGTPPGGAAPTSYTARVAGALSNLPGVGGAIAGWDAQHSGIPIRQAPGNSPIVGYIPWGGVFQGNGQMQTYGNSMTYPGQSQNWLPVNIGGVNGYVNQSDIGATNTPQQGGGARLPSYSANQPLTSTMSSASHPGFGFTPAKNSIQPASFVPQNPNILMPDALQGGPSVIPSIAFLAPTSQYSPVYG